MRADEEYRDVLVGCAAAAGILSWLDLPKMLAAIEHADAVGPLIDPTLYRDKAQAMREDAELLRAALPLRDLWLARKKKAASSG